MIKNYKIDISEAIKAIEQREEEEALQTLASTNA